MNIKIFTFNPFYENTYVLSDATGECVIVDPGCHIAEEEQELASYIEQEGLKPVRLINTHCHVDHVFGNRFVSEKWNLPLEIHLEDLKTLQSFPQVCMLYGFNGYEQQEPGKYFEDGDVIHFGNTALEVLFTPGHSPGSVCFYNKSEGCVIGGDVLFQGSIGRTDLPGGSYEILENSIRTKLYVLPDQVKVYPGHGPHTTIGFEKKYNPFVGG
ncbi:MAG: MBL fold metallo-hydrolase [Bacteroidia bacterium]